MSSYRKTEKYKKMRRAYMKKWSKRPDVKKKIAQKNKKYFQKPGIKEKRKKYLREYYKNIAKPETLEKIKNYKKEYDKKRYTDPELRKKRRIRHRVWSKKRKESDPFFKLRRSLGSRLNSFLKTKKKSKKGSIIDMIGCSRNFLKSYLEKQFYLNPITKEKMTWKNYGKNGWEVDHIRPFSDFKSLDISSFEVQKKIMHYTNLQPMWGFENREKSDLIYLIKPNYAYSRLIYFKKFSAKNTLSDLDKYVKKKLKEVNDDLEVDISIAIDRNKKILCWIKSKKLN
jgi:hypothetical protein